MSRTVTSTTEVEDLTIPDSPAALEEFMSDKANVFALLKNNRFSELVQAYAGIVMKEQLDIREQVKEQVQGTLTEWLRDNAEDGFAPVNVGAVRRGAERLIDPDPARVEARAGLYNPQAMGAKLDDEFRGPHAAADYFKLIWGHFKRQLDASGSARMKRVRDAFESTVPSDGGFLIPETLRSEMLRVSLESAVVRPRARVIPMETLRVPFPMIDTTTNAGNLYGGITAYWTEEGSEMTDSSPKFGRLQLEAKKLTVYTEVPQELVADSVLSFQPFISEIFPEAMAYFEDRAFLKGSGVGEPLGALHSSNTATIVQAEDANQPAGTTIVWENLIGMFARLLPSSMGRAVWLASPDTLPELATMALSVGTGGAPVWLSNGAQSPPMTILGRPVVFTEKAPGVLGSQGDISLVDLSYYLVGDRQVMSASASEHFRFNQDKIAYKIISRVDGRPWLQSAITPENGGPTLSPFVQLAARS